MKRFFLVLIGVSSIFVPLMAQARLGDFTMRGAASQEMKVDGFVAAHPSFPLNSKVKVTNPLNGREIEATVIDRIDPSLNRIIDLSPAAMQALGMKAGEQVVLTVGAPARPLSRSQRAEEPIIELEEPSLTTVEQDSAENDPENPASPTKNGAKTAENEKEKDRPYNLTVNAAYLDEKKAANDDSAGKSNNSTEFLAWLMTMSSLDAREARDSREIRESRDIRDARDAREAVKTSAPPRQRDHQPPAPQYMPPAPPPPQPFFDSAPVFQSPPAPAPRHHYAQPPQQYPQQQYAPQPQYAPPPVAPQYAPPPVAPEPPMDKEDPWLPPAPPAPAHYKPVPPPQESADVALESPPKNGKNGAAKPEPVAAAKIEPSAAADVALESPPKNGKNGAAKPDPEPEPEIGPPKEPIPVRRVPPAAVYPLPVKAEDIQIIPGLPDRSSGKTYRLQIGAYSAQDAATRAAEHIRASGFDVELESSGTMFRVLAIGIASPDVYQASIRLGALGFRQIWVKE